MSCLTDPEIQAAADGAANERLRSHLDTCTVCRDRVDERRADFARLADAIASGGMPPDAEARIGAAIGAGGVRGATVLRGGSTVPRGAGPLGPVGSRWQYAAVVAALAAAALLLVVYLVRLGAPAPLSAAVVLGRSLQSLSSARGIERLEYELTVGGAGSTTHRIEQLVDYDHPTRFRLANYRPDGELESAISEDPFAGRRTHLVRIDARNYVFEFAATGAGLIPVPELARAQLEAVIAMMQATADQKLTVVDGGREYVIQIPPVTPHGGTGMLDLYQARAVIDGRDFRIREFEGSGALLGQPCTVSFRLIRRTPLDPAGVSPRDFEIAVGPDDVVLKGEATADPFADLVGTALREVARSRTVTR